jgi:hypothetical protein
MSAVHLQSRASFQRYQFSAPDPPAVDAPGHWDPQFLAQGLDPHAPSIVHVARDHANCAAGRPRDSSRPQLRRQVLDPEDRDPVAGPPGVEEVLSLHDATGVFSNSMFLSHTVPAPSTARFSLMRSGFWPLFK